MSPLSVWDSVWKLHDDRDELHITPPDDLVAHELDLDCPCGPVLDYIGGKDWVVEHEALDGRT